MKFSNIVLGSEVEIDPSTSFNNIVIGDRVKIAKNCTLFGSLENSLEIGTGTYIGMNCTINGFTAKIIIGNNVSIAQNVNIMADSGPNASITLQNVFPLEKGQIRIGNHNWIGASVIIMPKVILGDYVVVAANSFVNKSFPAFSIIGGSPAKLIRVFTKSEIESLKIL